MTLSAIHNLVCTQYNVYLVVCDIGGYDFVSYSQPFLIVEPVKSSCL